MRIPDEVFLAANRIGRWQSWLQQHLLGEFPVKPEAQSQIYL